MFLMIISSDRGLKSRNAQLVRGTIPAYVVDAVEFVCNTRNCGSFINFSASLPGEGDVGLPMIVTSIKVYWQYA